MSEQATKLKTFTVYEVQQEVVWRKWTHEVEAESEEDAIDKVRAGEGGDPIDHGEYGEVTYEESGYSALEGEHDNDCEFEVAASKMES